MSIQEPLPMIDGVTPVAIEAKAAATKVWTPRETHRDHGDKVYFLVEAHVSNVAHPEIVEDGLRIGVSRVETLKADGAWLLGADEGDALAKVAMRRRQLHESGGQKSLIPDGDLRDKVRAGLVHLLDEVNAVFSGAPDDLSGMD